VNELTTHSFCSILSLAVLNSLEVFMTECRNQEARRHMYEAIAILKVGQNKLKKIQAIIENFKTAPAA